MHMERRELARRHPDNVQIARDDVIRSQSMDGVIDWFIL